MPPESSSRKASRKSTAGNDEDIETRRARGEISCAECRRLKLKCDKKIPCSSCIRRGCASICPNGSLSTGQGTRFVLADTSQLHSKIAEMGQRIRQLEDALAIFQSGVSNDCHPLLVPDLLTIKFGPEVSQSQQAKDEHLSSTVDALGTLTIGERGEKYYGRSAGSETLFLAGSADADRPDWDDPPVDVSSDISRLSNSFPFGEALFDCDTHAGIIVTYLPDQMRAWSLVETYVEHWAWSFNPIKRDEIVEELMTPIYKFQKERQTNASAPPVGVTPHKAAVLFIIFAIAAWVDLASENYAAEAERYYHLSRACLSLRSVFDSPEIATVQAIALMSAFHSIEGKKFTMDSAWSLLSLACKLGQSLGLHRDSARWNMDAKTVARRRHLFWELFSNEQFHSIGLGRPPTIRLSYIDTELPEDNGAVDKDGNPLMGFYRWKHEYVRLVFFEVTEVSLSAVPPKYEVILELDRRVREKPLPPHLNTLMDNNDHSLDGISPTVYMHACLLGQYRSVTLMYIHKSFFAQALLDHPINPLRSPYAPSFLASYRCASWMIKSTRNHYERFPDLFLRLWHPWTHLFSSAIVMGSIVTHAPSCAMATRAFEELNQACDLYEIGALRSRSLRTQSGWRILHKLRDKAYDAFSQNRNKSPTTKSAGVTINAPDYGEDELAIFGGQTRILVTKQLSKLSKRSNTQSSALSETNSAPSPASSSSTDSQMDVMQDVHPSLVEYISKAPESHFAQFGGMQGIFPTEGNINFAQFLPPTNSHAPQQPLGQVPQVPQMTHNNSSMDTSPFDAIPSTFQTSHVQDQSFMAAFDPNSFDASGLLPNQNSLPIASPDDQYLMMMSGQSAMTDQWKSFMNEFGLLEEPSNPAIPLT